jgi:hypothetical protein
MTAARKMDVCRGQGCGRPVDRRYLVDGVCQCCAPYECACEHCGVVVLREAMEELGGDAVCRECADEEHRENERAEELAYGPMSIDEAEGRVR